MVHYTDEQIADLILRDFDGRRIALLAPVVKGRKGHYRELFEQLAKKGYIYARIDGEIREIAAGMKLDRYKIHTVDLVVDRLGVSPDAAERLMSSLQEAMRQGKVAKDVVIEACFIPMQLPSEDSGLLQFFVTLFQGAPDMNVNQLRRACSYCNDFCALGSFGLFEQGGQIYLKHNTLLDGSLELEKIIPFVADNISLLLAAVSRFIDGLAQVAYAGMTLDAVIDQELFPKVN